jgi:hypothetical protein
MRGQKRDGTKVNILPLWWNFFHLSYIVLPNADFLRSSAKNVLMGRALKHAKSGKIWRVNVPEGCGGGLCTVYNVHCAVSVYSIEEKDGLGMKMCGFLIPRNKRSIYLLCLLKGSREKN